MTDRQKRFAENYVTMNNASQAYLAAGYSDKHLDKNSYKLLNKPEIIAYIQLERDKTAQAMQLTKEDIINDLLAIKDLCFSEPKFVGNSIKALAEINKMLGFLNPEKIELSGEVNHITWVEEKTYDKK